MSGLLKLTLKRGLYLLASVLLATQSLMPLTAFAGNVDKPEICHPVNGNGETGTGWNLISPDHASSHIDESLYPDGEYWKHTSNDGRHDVYAVNGVCPTNESGEGKIVIEKNAINDSSQVFSFTTAGLDTDQTGFNLIDDSTTGLPKKEFNNLGAGNYTVTEKRQLAGI